MDPSQQAAYNPMIQGGMAGQDSMMQARLCGWLPALDMKPFMKLEEFAGLQFLNKNIMRNEQMKFIFCMNTIPILSELWDLLAKMGRDIPDWAFDIIPADLRQALLDNDVEGLDAGHMKSLIGNMALQNVAMNAAAMHHDDGMSV